jgi:murein DD-endopeptidase
MCLALSFMSPLWESLPRTAETLHESFDISVPQAPIPVAVANKRELVYEVHLTNFSSDDLLLYSLAVFDESSHRQVSMWSDGDLAKRFRLLGKPDDLNNPSMIVHSGQTAIVYIEYECAANELPAELDHRVDYSVAGQPAHFIVKGGRTTIPAGTPVELSPPLRGGPWVAAYSPDWQRGHRRVFYAIEGTAHLPGRFAIDFILVDDQGKTTHGDPDRVQDALDYGAPVLAVADAEVVAIRDGIPESEKISQNRKHSLEDAPGNTIVLQLDDRRFAVYEHLKPGSVRVSVGSRVRRGQTIAALGFTGDSTVPHLHLDVADGPEPLNAEGLPFVCTQFSMIGQYTHVEDVGVRRWDPLAAGRPELRVHEMPQPNAVLFFQN